MYAESIVVRNFTYVCICNIYIYIYTHHIGFAISLLSAMPLCLIVFWWLCDDSQHRNCLLTVEGVSSLRKTRSQQDIFCDVLFFFQNFVRL